LLIEIYIEALLVDEELADQVWEAGDMGEIVEKQVRRPVLSLGSTVAYI
jgi:hypothetical protein